MNEGEYYIFAAVFIGDENNIHIMKETNLV